jgi:hypothetical protein
MRRPGDRERLIRRFHEFTNEFPWQWTPGHVDEWPAGLTGERHLAPSAIRAYQGDVRLFTEFYSKRCGPGLCRARARYHRAGQHAHRQLGIIHRSA